jgi:integrase
VLDAELVPKVLKAVEESPRDSALLHIGVFCAMRPSEVFGLRWSSLRGDHFVIRNSAWEGKLLPDQAKGAERRVFIPPATRAAILRWHDTCHRKLSDDLMFPSKKGTPITTIGSSWLQSTDAPSAAVHPLLASDCASRGFCAALGT